MNPVPLCFVPKPPAPIVRPGIFEAATISTAGICRVSATEAQQRVGGGFSGHILPYFNLDGTPVHRDSDGAQPYARLRLDSPLGDMRYFQPVGKQSCLYLPPRLGELLQMVMHLHGGKIPALFLTEGEFKSLAACEANILAAGIGGISSAVVRGELVHGLGHLLHEWPIERVVLVGDSDVGILYDFSRAAVALAKAVPDDVAVRVIAPGLDAPAKGLDDQREKLGGGFADYWAGLVAKAVSVPRGLTADELALQLLRQENPATIRAIYRNEFEHQ